MNAQQRPRPSDELYAEVVHVPCPRCMAVAGAVCVNQITLEAARVPHWQRVRAAEGVGS